MTTHTPGPAETLRSALDAPFKGETIRKFALQRAIKLALPHIVEIEKQVADLLEALEEIAKGKGAYSPDQLEHAGNTIDDMKSIATAAIALAKP